MKNVHIILILFFSTVLIQCTPEKRSDDRLNPAFAEYITGFTSGVVSRVSPVQLRLAKPSKSFTSAGEVINSDLFEFEPSLEGVCYWLDNQTLEFKPVKSLKSGTRYAVTFKLGNLLDVDKAFDVFRFSFQTRTQSFTIDIDGMAPIENTSAHLNKVTGQILSADHLESSVAEKLASFSIDNEQLFPVWIHNPSGTTHTFVLDSIERHKEKQILNVSYNGKPYAIEHEGSFEFEIPSIDEFKLMSCKVEQGSEQAIILRFSDPLDEKQDLRGLVTIEGVNDLRIVKELNILKVYPPNRLNGVKLLHINSNVRNAFLANLGVNEKVELEFIESKPQVAFNHKGVILPPVNGVVFPFRAVNINAVDLTVIKIFEANVHQFLQVNALMGDYQLNRVGKPILRKKIDLTSDRLIERGVWNNFSIDLTELIRTEPGAIYRVTLGIRKSYSTYSCGSDENQNEEDDFFDTESFSDSSDEWGYFDQDYGYGNYYDWEERDNPCHKAYYHNGRSVSTNILASNIGIIAKSGSDNSLLVALNEIETASAVRDSRIEVYDFQNQRVGQGVSDKNGMARIECSDKPFLVVATKNNERAYLRLPEGAALSTSHFDVSGAQVQDGIKGFIYGDRGVWRPGDTMYVSFILDDSFNKIPEDYPVSLELFDPKNTLRKRMLSSRHVNGIYSYRIPTSPDDITGSWLAQIRIGKARFSKSLRIETIKPNRLKINFDLGVDEIPSNHKDLSAELEARWLHGATAKNLKTRINVSLSPSETAFDGYEEYSFVDYIKSYTADEQLLFDGKLDSEGQVKVPIELRLGDVPPGKLNARFTTRVFENGGDFSIDRFTSVYSPYNRYVGIKLQDGLTHKTYSTDTLNSFEIVCLDEEGSPIDAENIEVQIFKTNWRWWWDASNDYYGNYVGNQYRDLVYSTEVSTRNGKARVDFKIDYPEWGRFIIRVSDKKGGHSATEFMYVDWPEWRDRNSESQEGAASVLELQADKETYKPGEKARITIPASGKGRALLTVENGSDVLHAEWLTIDNEEVIHELDVTREMSPNVFINVSTIQEYAHENSLPIRLYGILDIEVNDPSTHIEPVIEMSNELSPESNVPITISEKNGKPTSYTLAIVDEGLLDLTRYTTPNPHASFYAREALGVKTWDIYDLIIGAYGGKLERVLSIGGDEGSTRPSKAKINRFKPMVRFEGPFELNSRGKNTHDIYIPNYIGSVRVMVVAGQNGAFGSAEKTVPVKKPLMVLGTLPRVLGPGEKVSLPVTVFAMDDKIKEVKLELKANDLFKQGFTKTQTIRFDTPDEKIVNFDLELMQSIGKAEVEILVSGHGEKAHHSIELEVRNANSPVSRFKEVVIEVDSTWDTDYSIFGIDGTNEVVLELSRMPPIDFDRRLKQLIAYPHGCAEQTISQAFPQLFLSDVMEVDVRLAERTKRNVQSAIDRLRSFQHTDGGFRFWPSYTESNDWVTSYIGHFMIEAERKGYLVPVNIKSEWKNYQETLSRNYKRYTDTRDEALNRSLDFAQAYRLFTLALDGDPDIGSMNRLKEKNSLDADGLWRLAAAYLLAGQSKVAEDIVGGLKTFVEDKTDESYYYSYGSAIRDEAMILEAMVIMDKRDDAVRLMKRISSELSSSKWMSTQTTAYCLLAMSKFAGKQSVSNEMKLTYAINDDESETITSLLPIKRIPLDLESVGESGSIHVSNAGEGIIYGSLVTTGVPLYGEEKEESSIVSVKVKYTTVSGDPLNVSLLDQGTDFLAHVTVSNTGSRETLRDMALTQVVPSGWEIIGLRLEDGLNVHAGDIPSYQDIRDDRVLSYFDIPYTGRRNKGYPSRTFVIPLSATYLGKYYLPGVKAEAMYDGQVHATSKGQWIQVIKPGSVQ